MDEPSKLIVVANRLPVKRVTRGGKADWEVSPGGLVTAMHPLLEETGGAWIGWQGTTGKGSPAFQHGRIWIRPVQISKQELRGFYEGFSNSTLWPLYHDAVRTPEFRRRWWGPYQQVNQRYAEATLEVAEPGDVVWVHDYQLQLVPGLLRERRPDLKIGFFLHIPFPAEELFARMPWRSEVIRGLLGADVLGFQSRLGAQNFARAAKHFSSAHGRESELRVDGRTVRVGAFPISIDTRHFEELAGSEPIIKRETELRHQLGPDRKVILGVDRLDYTKGIDVRLRAIEEIFRRGRYTCEDVVFIQVAVPSREKVAEYAEMRSRIEELVGRINGQYARPGQVAVHYLRRSLPQDELTAYYRLADVMVVTPLRDGMNLVAKEYVASRLDGSGVLVLSEFTGSASELRQAMLVNPFDIDGVATSIEGALELDPGSARKRMMTMRRHIREHDVYEWADRFLRAVEG